MKVTKNKEINNKFGDTSATERNKEKGENSDLIFYPEIAQS